MASRRTVLKRSAILAAGVAGVAGLYTWLVEPHWVEFVRRRLPIRGLSRDLEGRTIVQISDVHVGPSVDELVSGLQIVGVDDFWSPRFDVTRALAQRDREAPSSLVLCHNPDGVDEPGWEDYNGWILAGHTHGGQCRPPFLPPPLIPVRNRRYTAGEFALDGGRRLYINRGLGHLLKVRFNVRPEVTLFHLTRA
jgi:predicted MPP superfamily phosphohydrolase